MSNPYKISVIIPFYNTENWLPRCLDSLVRQNLRGIEIICIDDCSVDNSLEIVEKYSKYDKRIRILKNTVHLGVGASRNRGLLAASGEYIGFVDSDDFIAHDMYNNLYKKAYRENADIVKGVILGYDNYLEKCTLRDFFEINELILAKRTYFCCGFTSSIIRRSILEKNKIFFPEGLITMEDPCFTIFATLYAANVYIVDDAFYFYAHNNNSSTSISSPDATCESTYKACKIIYEKINSIKISYDDSIQIMFFMYNMIFYAMMHADSEKIVNCASCILNMIVDYIKKEEDFYLALYKYEKSKNSTILTNREHRMNQIEQIEFRIKKEIELKNVNDKLRKNFIQSRTI